MYYIGKTEFIIYSLKELIQYFKYENRQYKKDNFKAPDYISASSSWSYETITKARGAQWPVDIWIYKAVHKS